MNKNKNTPSLDLSYAYGSTTIEKLSKQDIELAPRDDDSETGDTTIRAVTSLFKGIRLIEGADDILRFGYDPYNSAEDDADIE